MPIRVLASMRAPPLSSFKSAGSAELEKYPSGVLGSGMSASVLLLGVSQADCGITYPGKTHVGEELVQKYFSPAVIVPAGKPILVFSRLAKYALPTLFTLGLPAARAWASVFAIIPAWSNKFPV